MHEYNSIIESNFRSRSGNRYYSKDRCKFRIVSCDLYPRLFSFIFTYFYKYNIVIWTTSVTRTTVRDIKYVKET